MKSTLSFTFYHLLKAHAKTTDADYKSLSEVLAKTAEDYYGGLSVIPEEAPAELRSSVSDVLRSSVSDVLRSSVSDVQTESKPRITRRTESQPLQRKVAPSARPVSRTPDIQTTAVQSVRRIPVSVNDVINGNDETFVEPTSFKNQYSVTLMDDSVYFTVPEKR